MQKPNIVPLYVTYSFFAIGLMSSIAFRAIIVFQRMEPDWVRPVWYIGSFGYLLFFLYRFKITKKRKKAISDFSLLEKVENNTLSDEDRKVILYILASIKVSREDINYVIIFILSIVAISADIVLSAVKY